MKYLNELDGLKSVLNNSTISVINRITQRKLNTNNANFNVLLEAGF